MADSAAAGRNLKSRGGIWSSKGTDNRGFHAMPGGARYTDGTFDQVENAAYFWTSSANGDYGAWYRDLTISSILVSNSADMKTRAFSVRCAQD